MTDLFAFHSQWQLYMCWKCQMQSKSSMALVVQGLGWFQCKRSPLHIFLWQSKLQFLWKRCRNESMDPVPRVLAVVERQAFLSLFLSLRGDSGTGATAEVSDPTCLGEGATGILLVGWAPVKFGVIRQSLGSSVFLVLCDALLSLLRSDE